MWKIENKERDLFPFGFNTQQLAAIGIGDA